MFPDRGKAVRELLHILQENTFGIMTMEFILMEIRIKQFQQEIYWNLYLIQLTGIILTSLFKLICRGGTAKWVKR